MELGNVSMEKQIYIAVVTMTTEVAGAGIGKQVGFKKDLTLLSHIFRRAIKP